MDVVTARNRLDALDQSVTRLKNFAQKLRVIGNLESPETAKLLNRMPEAQDGTPGGGFQEDSGTIETPGSGRDSPPGESDPLGPAQGGDIHSQLEFQRSQTVLGELGQEISSQNLTEQINQVSNAAAALQEIAELEEQSFAEIQESFQDRVDRLLATPSVAPASGYISSEFGYRMHPALKIRRFHAGIDIANNVGTPIFSPADGLVTFSGPLGGFGQVVEINHGYSLVTKYGHNSRNLVRRGDRVKRGDKIALMGSSGVSTGPHLHYQIEVRGRPVNPRFFLLDDTF
jgi:murein DD-endopeptidase MepM/ murein hydrolase activator NlpD